MDEDKNKGRLKMELRPQQKMQPKTLQEFALKMEAKGIQVILPGNENKISVRQKFPQTEYDNIGQGCYLTLPAKPSE